MIRERMWEGTPIPAPKRKRSMAATSISDSPNQSSSESETDEWPSPSKRSKSSDDTSDSDETSSGSSTSQHPRHALPPTLTTIQSARTRIDPVSLKQDTQHYLHTCRTVARHRHTPHHTTPTPGGGGGGCPAPTHIRPPFRRRNRQELETYIHYPQQLWHTQEHHKKGEEGGGGGGSGGAEEANRTVEARGEELSPSSRPPALTTHTQDTRTHTRRTLHRNLQP